MKNLLKRLESVAKLEFNDSYPSSDILLPTKMLGEAVEALEFYAELDFKTASKALQKINKLAEEWM